MLADLGEPVTNLERIAVHVRALAAEGARVVALPEAMNAGYLFDSPSHALELGERLDGPFVSGLAKLATETGVWIACGITERDDDDLYNTAVLVGPEVGLVARHRKVNLAPHDRRWFQRGDGRPAVADTPHGRLGLFICYDSRLPQVARGLALAGTDLMINCANFFSEDKAALHIPIRAAENGVPILAASKAGQERAATYMGGTCLVDADGNTVALLGPEVEEGTIVAEVSTKPEKREERLRSRQPASYGWLDVPFADTPAGKAGSEPIVVSESMVQVAAIQGRWADPSELERRLDEVSTLGAGIWVLPQYPCDERPFDARGAEAVAARSPATLDAIARATRRAQAWCVLGTVVRDASGPVAVHALVGPDGTVQICRRVHLDEATSWSPTGSEWFVAPTPWGRLGIVGGADIAHPESGRCLALQGADLLCVTAAIDSPWIRDFAVLERSSETRCHVVMANRIDGCVATGRSAVIPLTGFPTPKPLAAGRAGLDDSRVVTGFIEMSAARNKYITTGTHLFDPTIALVEAH